MRTNEHNQMASYSSTQLVQLNFHQSPEKNDLSIQANPMNESGLDLSDIKRFKRHLGRN